MEMRTIFWDTQNGYGNYILGGGSINYEFKTKVTFHKCNTYEKSTYMFVSNFSNDNLLTFGLLAY